jgi:acyl carrier protein
MSGPFTLESLSKHILDLVRGELLEVDSGFDTKSNLIEAGLHSLAVTQLMLSIQEATGVWVDEGLLTPENLESCQTLAACVQELLPAAG